MTRRRQSRAAAAAIITTTLAWWGLSCGGSPTPEAGGKEALAVGPSDSAGAALFDVRTISTCAGFGPADAAPLLGVAPDAVRETSSTVSPALRVCTFVTAGDGSRSLSFSLEHDDSEQAAAKAYADMRDSLPIASRAQKGAGAASDDSPLIEILGLGDEALWTSVNGALTVRRGNVTMVVMAPPDRKAQIDVARAVLGRLRLP